MDPKRTVRRLIEEGVNGGRDSVLEELFVPDALASAREWFGSFAVRSPTSEWN